jgi:hypothetical protein
VNLTLKIQNRYVYIDLLTYLTIKKTLRGFQDARGNF